MHILEGRGLRDTIVMTYSDDKRRLPPVPLELTALVSVGLKKG